MLKTTLNLLKDTQHTHRAVDNYKAVLFAQRLLGRVENITRTDIRQLSSVLSQPYLVILFISLQQNNRHILSYLKLSRFSPVLDPRRASCQLMAKLLALNIGKLLP